MPYPGARKRIRILTSALDETTEAYTATDPTTLTITVEDPDGTETTYDWDGVGGNTDEITKHATGHFYVDITCDTEGEWKTRASCTGALLGAVEAVWTILPSRVL